MIVAHFHREVITEEETNVDVVIKHFSMETVVVTDVLWRHLRYSPPRYMI